MIQIEQHNTAVVSIIHISRRFHNVCTVLSRHSNCPDGAEDKVTSQRMLYNLRANMYGTKITMKLFFFV